MAVPSPDQAAIDDAGAGGATTPPSTCQFKTNYANDPSIRRSLTDFEDRSREMEPVSSRGSFRGDDLHADNDASYKDIVQKLKALYHDHVVEAEKRYHLHFNFCLPTDGEIKDSEFDATPMVLLIGQYSTGKVR